MPTCLQLSWVHTAFFSIPLVCRGDLFRRLNSDIWVPFSRWKNDDLIKKLVNSCDEVFPVPGLISHITEQLKREEGEERGECWLELFYLLSGSQHIWKESHWEPQFLPQQEPQETGTYRPPHTSSTAVEYQQSWKQSTHFSKNYELNFYMTTTWMLSMYL